METVRSEASKELETVTESYKEELADAMVVPYGNVKMTVMVF